LTPISLVEAIGATGGSEMSITPNNKKGTTVL